MGHGSDFLLETAPATPANGIQRCSTQSGNAGFKRGDLGTKIAQLSPTCAGQPLLLSRSILWFTSYHEMSYVPS